MDLSGKNAWETGRNLIKRREPQVLVTPTAHEHSDPDKEDRAMPENTGSITQIDSASNSAKAFKDSQEASFRRVIRQSVRRGPFTKSEREVVLAFVNHWFHHRNSQKKVVHPGRKKLAKKAKVSIATVKRTLGMLRDHGAIVAVAHLHGLHGNATEYVVNVPALTDLCAKRKADLAVNGGSNDPTSGGVKMTHRIHNVVPFPSQRREA